MAMTKELRTQFIEFLTTHYSNNENKSLAAHLTIMVNAASDNTRNVLISERTVVYYAKKLGLKKSPEFIHSQAILNSVTDIYKHIGDNYTFYNDKPLAIIREVMPNKDRLVICVSRKQMKSLRNAACKYNKSDSARTGIHIKVSCDPERMSVLLIPETISLPASCRTHSSLPGGQCVPP